MGEIHTVEQGEYLASIAKDHGFADWHAIYDHPENADLKKKRPNPNILLPGDQVYIPDKQLKQESCPTEKKSRFQVKASKVWLKIVLKDSEGKALANQPYTLTVAWLKLTGTTDGAGSVRQKIPIGVDTGELSLDKLGLTWPLKIGHLDPVLDGDGNDLIVSGLQARLNNLGYDCGEVDGIFGPKTREAVQAFQMKELGRDETRATGEPDNQTLQALETRYGS